MAIPFPRRRRLVGRAVSIEAVLLPASFGWVCLQLRYDGRNPPLELLDELVRLGWSAPPPPARPASAIDWYSPNPLTGERFTVRHWQAVHDIDPPGRYRSPATWTPESRAGALRALASVFVDHHVTVSSSVPELAALATGTGPSGRRSGDALAKRDRSGPPPERRARPESDTRPEPGPGGTQAPAPGVAIVSFATASEHGEAIAAFLRETGLVHRMASETRIRREVYRGSVTERAVHVLVGEVVVRDQDAEALRDALRDAMATSESRPARPDDLARLDPVRRDTRPDTPPAVRAAPPVDPTMPAVLHVEITRSADGMVDRIITDPALAGLAVTVSPGTRRVASEYRGSPSETEQPCLHIEVSCPPERVIAAVAALAHETGVPEASVAVRFPGSR